MSPLLWITTLLERVTRELALRKRLQEALLVFSRGVSARLALDTALEALAREVNGLFGTERTSVWLHDRRTHSLTLAGSSDPRQDTSQERISDRRPQPDRARPRQEGVQVTESGSVPGAGRAAEGLAARTRHPGDRRPIAARWTTSRSSISRWISRGSSRSPWKGVVVLDELIRQQARLLQSEKLASLGQFIAGIAHEMNNPLQSVLGHLELMIESKQHAPHRAELRRIYHDADRAAKIVNNLLVFGGSQRARRRAVDVDGADRARHCDPRIRVAEDACRDHPWGRDVDAQR